jgi:hypothetical protein
MISEGEMARLETAANRIGLQAKRLDGGLKIFVYRLEALGMGESAAYVGSVVLKPGEQAEQMQLGDEHFVVAWLGPGSMRPSAGALGREPCCMVCNGVTICGQVVSAQCGRCEGNERASVPKNR